MTEIRRKVVECTHRSRFGGKNTYKMSCGHLLEFKPRWYNNEQEPADPATGRCQECERIRDQFKVPGEQP